MSNDLALKLTSLLYIILGSAAIVLMVTAAVLGTIGLIREARDDDGPE